MIMKAFDLLRWAMAEQVQLRFIEQMPLDPQHGWKRDEMITADEIKEHLGQHVELVEDPEDALTRGSAPAELFRVAGTGYSVGIIASVSKPFCGACDRVRLTADGQIRNCLFARTESDLRTPLRSGASDSDIAARWVAAVAEQTARPRHQRPELPLHSSTVDRPPCRPSVRQTGQRGSTSFRNPRAERNCARDSR